MLSKRRVNDGEGISEILWTQPSLSLLSDPLSHLCMFVLYMYILYSINYCLN